MGHFLLPKRLETCHLHNLFFVLSDLFWQFISKPRIASFTYIWSTAHTVKEEVMINFSADYLLQLKISTMPITAILFSKTFSAVNLPNHNKELSTLKLFFLSPLWACNFLVCGATWWKICGYTVSVIQVRSVVKIRCPMRSW